MSEQTTENAQTNAANEAALAGTPAATAVKPVLGISAILKDLKDGMTREEIRLKLGITKAQMTRVMADPKLKNRKPKTALPFTLVDDAPDVVPIKTNPKGPKKEKVADEGGDKASVTSEATDAPKTEAFAPAPVAEAADTKGSW